jgi:hypothetical protein
MEENIMNRRWTIGTVLALVLGMWSAAWAHEGHTHKVMGTVVSLQGDHLDVKTSDGKTVTLTLDTKTTVTRGTAKLDRTALKPGERVSIDATEQKKVMIAGSIKLGTAPASTAKK